MPANMKSKLHQANFYRMDKINYEHFVCIMQPVQLYVYNRLTSKESLKIFIFFLLKVVLTENQNAVFKSSHWRCSVKKGVLKNFAKFTGKHLCQSLFFNKVAGLRPVEKETLAHVFPVNFKKFLRTTFLQNTFK